MQTKIKRILSVTLTVVMLLGLFASVSFANAVQGDGGIAPQADLTDFHRMTDPSELQDGRHYIFVYPTKVDGSYPALTAEAEGGYYTGLTALTDAVYSAGKGLAVSTDESFVLSLAVSTADEWNFTADNGPSPNRLKLNSGVMYHASSPGAITVTAEENNTWTLRNSRPLRWNGSGFEAPTSGSAEATPVEIWTDAVEPARYTMLTSSDQLKDLGATTPYMVVVVGKDGKRRAIGRQSNSNTWLFDVEQLESDNIRYIEPGQNSSIVFQSNGGCTFSTSESLGEYYRFKFLQLSAGNQLWLDGPAEGQTSYNITRPPFRADGKDSKQVERNNEITFQSVGDDSGQFYLRGNATDRWLCYADDGYATGDLTGDRAKVEVYVYLPANGDVHVRFLDTAGAVFLDTYVENKVTLARQLGDMVWKGEDYRFAGWSADPRYADPNAAFLSLADSANLYGYRINEKVNAFLDKAKSLGLLGDGDPENPSTVNLDEIPGYVAGNDLTLYAVYARRGFDGVVTAKENGVDVVGVSDWKADQNREHRYQDPERERWLGAIDLEIYKDGKLWVSEPLYFSYHDDNSADLNIKFVWDDLVEQYGGLYDFMSHYDEKDFPLYDQVGHFTVDGAYATQGAGQFGLFYMNNWLTDHGGQLDNVRGGYPVRLYVTTKYNVKYYLDDKLIEADGYVNPKIYTTTGTAEAVKADRDGADFTVTKDNEYKDLMLNGDYGVNDAFGGNEDDDDVVRAGISSFYYDLHDEESHVIPTAASPAGLTGDKQLSSTSWVLKNKNGDEVEKIAWGADYAITGTTVGTGNTAHTFKDAVDVTPFEADSPYTYHLYAYTGMPQTGDSVDPFPWLAAMAASLFGLCAAYLLYRADRKAKAKQ